MEYFAYVGRNRPENSKFSHLGPIGPNLAYFVHFSRTVNNFIFLLYAIGMKTCDILYKLNVADTYTINNTKWLCTFNS